MASRILGLGDMLTLIEKVEASVDAGAAQKLAEKGAAGEFTLEDLRDQLASMKKMGPIEGLIDLLPKGGAFKALRQPEGVDEKALTRVGAIIDSMTPEERRYPQVLNGSRKKRIAGGSGTSVVEINRLLKQYQQMRRLMRTAKKGVPRAGPVQAGLPQPAPAVTRVECPAFVGQETGTEMLKIRLRRMGARNRPYYRIVVSDSRRATSAEVLEELGSYDPVPNPPRRALRPGARPHWIAKGASGLADRPIAPRAPRARAGRGLGSTMKRLIETIVRRLADRPEETRVTETFEGKTAVYDVHVPEVDRGRLIGREGRTVRALRSFVAAAAAARGKRVLIRVRD